MGERGISLVALIITVIIIIIIAAIVGSDSGDIMNRTERMSIETELRNVDEFVSNQKAKIMAGQISIPETYVATTAEINEFKNIDNSKLNGDMISSIISTNNSEVDASEKYHLMNQSAFKDVFARDINVKDIRRTYLVNFTKGVVILKVSDELLYVIGEI